MKLIVYGAELLFNEAMAYLMIKHRHQVIACPVDIQELAGVIDFAGVDACIVELSNELDATRVREVKRLSPAMPTIAITAELDTTLAQLAVSAGADGICLKVDGIEEIESVVARAYASSDRVSRVIWSKRARYLSAGKRVAPDGTKLTSREGAVLDLLMRGGNTASIAKELGVSQATVYTHLQHLFDKFDVHTRIALVAAAARSAAPEMRAEPIGAYS